MARAEALEEEEKLEPGVIADIQAIRGATERAASLTRQLLAFSRKQPLRPQMTNINDLVGMTSKLLGRTLGENIQLEYMLADDLCTVEVDRGQIEAALVNLCINARDAMPEGGTIVVSGGNATAASDNPLGLPAGDYVVLAVADSGSGIPADILEQVTEPFFTTKEVGKGTGLGLSMVYGFARQSGGAIAIDSKVGEGTRVEMWLPRATRPDRAAPPGAPEHAVAGVRPLRILLVDDHEAVRETTAGMLCDMGHEVASAADGPEVLALLAAGPGDFDLIVTDYAMPLMSGGDMLRQARKLRPDIPGIIISGYADGQSISRKPSEVVVLTKPFTLDQMSAAIGAAVQPPSQR
jgi:CheY-like chemotaxis protein